MINVGWRHRSFAYASISVTLDAITLKILTTNAKRTHEMKFATSNHSTRLPASIIMSTLIMNHTNPKVSALIGSVKKRSIAQRVTWSIPSTSTTRRALPYPSTATHGRMYAASQIIAHRTKNLISNFIVWTWKNKKYYVQWIIHNRYCLREIFLPFL